ncbi:MAG: FAD-dependent monooxygenase [Planctomycetota bacterium]
MPESIAIVGGGITGLATAVALRGVGVDARVYERAPAFGEVGAGISLWPNATRVLRGLGVLDRLTERAGRIDRLSIRSAAGRELIGARTNRDDCPSLCVWRPDLIDALRAELPDEACVLGRQVTAVSQDDHRATLRFSDGAEASADGVIGADGIHSRIASAIGQPPPIRRHGYLIYRGSAPLPDGWPPGLATETWGERRRFGLLDTGGGRAYWYATMPSDDESDGFPPDERQRALLDAFSRWWGPIGATIEATDPAAILVGPAIDRVPRRVWARGRIGLLGDAAHPTTPNLGQGAGMGLEDAAMLADQVAAGADACGALEAVCRSRRRRTARVTRVSGWIGRAALLGGPVAWLRDAGTWATPNAASERNLRWLFAYGLPGAA